jgi:hypothetical protein
MIGKSQIYSKSSYLIPGVGEKIISQRSCPLSYENKGRTQTLS